MKSGIAAASAALAFSLAASTANAQALYEACAYDISYHCADVEPGDGRIAACLYAHTATLTDGCFQATDGVSRLMEGFFDRLETLQNACAQDVAAHCATAEIGDGRVLQCLAGAEAVSGECRTSLTEMGLRTGE